MTKQPMKSSSGAESNESIRLPVNDKIFTLLVRTKQIQPELEARQVQRSDLPAAYERYKRKWCCIDRPSAGQW